jgi:hypothetical protein
MNKIKVDEQNENYGKSFKKDVQKNETLGYYLSSVKSGNTVNAKICV